MKRLKWHFLFFCIALSLPLSYVIWRTYAGVAQEERAQLRFFAETLFDQMEDELSALVRREENRAVDEYNYSLAAADSHARRSPLADLPHEAYILGYLQNNPDGSLQTPLVTDLGRIPPMYRTLIDRLQEANRIFNRKKYALPPAAEPVSSPAQMPVPSADDRKGFAERYLAGATNKAAKTTLGQKSIRVEEISPRQAANLTQDNADNDVTRRLKEETETARGAQSAGEDAATAGAVPEAGRHVSSPSAAEAPRINRPTPESRFQVEVAPLQSVFIDADQVFIFRRVAIGDRIFRQGFILQVSTFLQHLARTHFDPHPMAGFTRLSLAMMDHEGRKEVVGAGAAAEAGALVAGRMFPAPFNFLNASLAADGLPVSAARRTLKMALTALGGVMLLGLLVIYQSVRSVVDLSERRSRFVSSVTHELKTPLTNIRMYVEMLEQGIAATPEREQTYLGIIGSESARLSRLINNVLELAKLEKKQRIIHMQTGRLEEVLAEMHSVMSPKLDQEGFALILPADPIPPFAYDREAMLQVLINLVENSVKFGRNAALRRICITVKTGEEWVHIAVSDTGPGIPRQALKHVFDDFYRADTDPTRAAGGTGIGLALVKKLVRSMGGHVQAANNAGPGCTITLRLPLNTTESK